MRIFLLASAAALSLAVVPAVLNAQDAPAAAATIYTRTAEQQTAYDAWPAERRTAYDAWSMAQKEYFWSLTPEQQSAYWILTPEQRVQVLNMTPEARTSAWASILNQVRAGASNSATSTVARTGMPMPGRSMQGDAPGNSANAPPAAESAEADEPPAEVSADASVAAAAPRAMPPSNNAGGAGNRSTRSMPTTGMSTGTPGNMTPPPAMAMNKSYPVCSRTVTDNCRNRGGV